MSDSTTETPTPAEELTPREWIYLGRRCLSNDKLGATFLDHTGREVLFDVKILGGVGCVYQVYASEDGSRARMKGPSAPRFVRASDTSDPRLLTWEAIDRTEVTLVEMRAREKRSKSDETFKATLAPIRDQYHKYIGYSRRAAFLAAVIEEVTR